MPEVRTKATFIRDLTNPEDLARIPETDWVITSGHATKSHPQGRLYLVNVSSRKGEECYPAHARYACDAAAYGDVAPPAEAIFNPHGIGLRAGSDRTHVLYVVNHGGREAVEVFRVDCRGTTPTITWIGAVILPDWCMANDVAPYPGGGFIVSNFCTGGVPNLDKVYARAPSGNVLHWKSRHEEVAIVPGSDLCSPNGVEMSPDGEACFVNSWARGEIVKISLANGKPQRQVVKVDFLPDNFTWTDDRKFLITTGQFADPADLMQRYLVEDKLDYPLEVVQIDPDTMQIMKLVRYDNRNEFGCASAALQVGEDIWVGTARHDGIAIF